MLPRAERIKRRKYSRSNISRASRSGKPNASAPTPPPPPIFSAIARTAVSSARPSAAHNNALRIIASNSAKSFSYARLHKKFTACVVNRRPAKSVSVAKRFTTSAATFGMSS